MKRLFLLTTLAALTMLAMADKPKTIRSGELWPDDGKPVVHWRNEWQF